jgi:hypothetical protein
LSERDILEILSDPKDAIKYIPNPSESVCLKMVQKEPFVTITNLRNPSEAVCLKAVSSEGWYLQYIKRPTPKVRLKAVQEHGKAIQYIKNPTEEECLAAVSQNGYALSYIKNPSSAVKMAAIKQEPNAIIYIENPTEAEYLEILKKNPRCFEYIENPSEKLCLFMIQNYNSSILEKIKNPSPLLRQESLKRDGWGLKYLRNLTEEEFLLGLETLLFKNEHNDVFEKLLTKHWAWRVSNYMIKTFKGNISFKNRRKAWLMVKQYQRFPTTTLIAKLL